LALPAGMPSAVIELSRRPNSGLVTLDQEEVRHASL